MDKNKLSPENQLETTVKWSKIATETFCHSVQLPYLCRRNNRMTKKDEILKN